MASPSKRLCCNTAMDINCSDVPVAGGSELSVHGVVTHLSPIKSSPKATFFTGKVSDGRSLNFICFEKKLHQDLNAYALSGKSAVLQRVDVKNTQQYGMQIKIKTSSQISSSNRSFDMATHKEIVVSIAELLDEDFDYACEFSMAAKVVDIGPVEMVGVRDGRKKKQQAKLADHTGCIDATLWGEDTSTLEKDKSYKLTLLKLTQFNGKKNVQITQYSKISLTADITEVHFPQPAVEQETIVKEGLVMCVSSVCKSLACVLCKNGVVDAKNEKDMGSCNLCGSWMKLASCQKNLEATVILDVGEGARIPVHIDNSDVFKECGISGDNDLDGIVACLLDLGHVKVEINKETSKAVNITKY